MSSKDFICSVKKSLWWSKLKDKRKNHIAEVTNKILEYNKKFYLNIEEEIIISAAYLHDIGKGLSKKEELEFIKNNNLQLDGIEKQNRALFHAPISAYIAETQFEINNKDILNAIRYHTIAKEEMTDLGKLLYFSDFISPDRKRELNNIIENDYKQGLDKLLIIITTEKIKYLISSSKIIHPNIVRLRNKLLLANKI